MSSPFDMESALAELRQSQQRIQDAARSMTDTTASASSTDRMVEATVDGNGRLVGMKISGARYRQIAPAELSERIVRAVREAQDEAARRSAEAMASMMPAGLDLDQLLSGDLDLDGMFALAASELDAPVFPDEEPRPSGRQERDGG